MALETQFPDIELYLEEAYPNTEPDPSVLSGIGPDAQHLHRRPSPPGRRIPTSTAYTSILRRRSPPPPDPTAGAQGERRGMLDNGSGGQARFLTTSPSRTSASSSSPATAEVLESPLPAACSRGSGILVSFLKSGHILNVGDFLALARLHQRRCRRAMGLCRGAACGGRR